MRPPEPGSHTRDRLPDLGNRLRSLLNVILGHAQLLGLNCSLDEEGRGQAREIERAARALAALAEELPGPSPSGAVPPPGLDAALSGVPTPVSAPHGQRILVVEDHPVNQAVLCRLIETLGCVADAVASGREALAQWQAGDYGLILADLNMPGMDGLDLARAVRAKEAAGKRIPIVAVTAATVSEARAACQAAGMDEVLAKPIGLDALRAVLRRWRIGQSLASTPIADAIAPEPALAGLFIDTARQDLADGRRLLLGRDGHAVADIMHKLKSSALSVDATRFSRMAVDLEQSARNGRWPEAERLLGELEDALADFEAASAKAASKPAMDGGGSISHEELRQAIQHDEFEVHFQPKVDAASLRPVGAEALARWQSARHGWVPPESFIALAERHGLIGPLSELLLTKALFGGARLAEAGFPLTIAVNLSVSWLAQPKLAEFILATLRVVGIPAARVVLEIADTGTMAAASASLDGLARLRQQGIGLAVDSFKPDAMCMAPLRRIGFGEFKLNHAWATAVSAERLASLEQVRTLGAAIAAKGIETAGDLEQARALKCDWVQGHLIAAAMPVEDLIRWLQARL